MKEFETTFAEGLKKGLREDDENPRNQEALVECLNAKPTEDGLIPIVPVTTPMAVSMAWPFPQVFDRAIAASLCSITTDVGYSGTDPLTPLASTLTSVTITNGLPPFTWAVTGTGLSWATATTNGRTNTLVASSSATGTGSWTATDVCGDETGGDISVTAGWVQHLDDDDWESLVPGVDDWGLWVVDHWTGRITNETTLALVPIGTWATDYRPTHVRVTFTTEGTAPTLVLYDTESAELVSEADYVTATSVAISWGEYDLVQLRFALVSMNEDVSVTNIEFYGG